MSAIRINYGQKGGSKYKNEKVEMHGVVFDSKLELRLFGELCLDRNIKKIEPHVRYELTVNNVNVCHVIPDFKITTVDGRVFFADAKSDITETAVSNVKFKLFRAIYGSRIYILPRETMELMEEISNGMKRTN